MATPESSSGSEIPREMLQEILAKLPTKDVASACCVSTLWRSVVRSPSFRKIHAANHTAAADTAPEVLLVSEKRAPGSFTEASVSLVSSGKPMCRVNIPSGYTLANVCNGFPCFASAAGPDDDAPPLVCNPVTGEHLTLPRPPPLQGRSHLLTALGFSPSTNEYKLFRLSAISARYRYSSSWALSVPSQASGCCYLDVCTLGGGSDGWRQHPYIVPYRASATVKDSPPTVLDGKLYVLTMNPQHERPDGILVVDVASEAHCTYPLPDYEDSLTAARANIFELRGRPCLAVNTVHCYRPKIRFWFLSSATGSWDLCYSFYVDAAAAKITDGTKLYDSYTDLPRGAWLDEEDMMLCYRIGDTFYKCDTRDYKPLPCSGCQPMGNPQELPPSSTDRSWIICGGYRPTLLSPLTFASPPPSNNHDDEFDHALLRALRCHKSKRQASCTNLIGRTAKRIC